MTENSELSEREIEILRLVATGASNKEIAQQLYISANTVKVHLRNIFSKIGATTRTEAAMYAVQSGLVPTGVSDLERVEENGDQAAEPLSADLSDNSAGASSLHSQAAPPTPVGWRNWLPWGSVAVLVIFVLVLWWFSGRGNTATPALPAVAPTVAPRWQARASLTLPRAGLALAVYENRLYALGGEAASGVTGMVERYDPQADAWEARQSKPLPVADITAGVIGGKIYIPGGRLADGSSSDTLEIYDPARDSWSRGARLPGPRCAYALAVFEGKLYLFGGWDGKGDTASTFRYDPELDEWEILEPMPTARSFAGAAVADGKLYVLGGRRGDMSLAVNEVYWPAREGTDEPRWTSAAALPAGRYAMGIASIVDVLYLVGGETQQEGGGITLAFAPAQNMWQEFPQPKVLTWSHMAVALLGSELYVLGGLIDQQPSAQNLAYKAIYTVSIPTIIKDQ